MRVRESAGRQLLEAMGFQNKKVLAMPEGIQKRLRNLHELSSHDYKSPTDPDDVALFRAISATIKEEGPEAIEVVPENGENGHVKEKPAAKQQAAAPKAPRGKGNLDRFGCRIGGEPAKINAVLRKRPQTAEQIAELVGLTPERVNWQLKYYQREKGYVKLTDKGWVLVEQE